MLRFVLGSSVSEPRFVEQIRRIVPRLSDDELPFVFALVIRIPECARALSDVHYSKLKGVLRDGPLPVVVPMLERASKVQQLEFAVRDRIKTLTIEEVTTNIKAGRLKEAAAEQAVNILPFMRLMELGKLSPRGDDPPPAPIFEARTYREDHPIT